MSLKEIRERWEGVRYCSFQTRIQDYKDLAYFMNNAKNDIEKLLKVAEAAAALMSEDDAREAVLHYNVFHALQEALKELEGDELVVCFAHWYLGSGVCPKCRDAVYDANKGTVGCQHPDQVNFMAWRAGATKGTVVSRQVFICGDCLKVVKVL